MIILSEDILNNLKQQAEAAAPIEACGYLAGRDSRIEKVYPMTNVDQSPTHFTLDPKEQFAVIKDVRQRDLKLLAVYHSHPTTPARMSLEDKRLAFDPEMTYMIYSLQDDILKGFVVTEDDEIKEIEMEIQ